MGKLLFYTSHTSVNACKSHKEQAQDLLPRQAQKDDFATVHDTDSKERPHHMLYDSADIFPHHQDQFHKSLLSPTF
ncbi:hypothetical protein H702_02085 [Streptococcus equinus JB1]|uniref:Uncharacterized protein n=1 Tax=Streptococcus equinus JB1 TaxID=1294274 RepID=A0A091CBI3_STREI|nr:hypothetical protein H702_02085 [Streptococcus equinus JB1]